MLIMDDVGAKLKDNDIQKLLTSFEALIDKGHSIIVVEHNLDLIKCRIIIEILYS